MILAAEYDPIKFGTHDPMVYTATRSARYWRIDIEWSKNGNGSKISVSTADKMRISEAAEVAKAELNSQLGDGELVEWARMKFWCGK